MTLDMAADKPSSPPLVHSTSRALAVTIVILCGASVTLWAASLTRIDVDQMGDTGLVSVLPVSFLVALGVLSTSFVLSIYGRFRAPWNAAHVGVLILIIHGTIPLIYDVPRFAYVYKHLGVVDLVGRYGTVDRTIDAYNNWPGFFLLNAMFRESSGLQSSLGYAAWAPVFFNLASAVLLFVAYRWLIADEPTRWMGVWIFLCGNWVGQDYLAPQAFGFLINLAIVTISLAWLPVRSPSALRTGRTVRSRLVGGAVAAWPRGGTRAATAADRTTSGAAARWSTSSRLAVILVLILFAAVVASHQLSPLMIVAGVTAILVFGGRRPWWLPVLMTLMTVAWFGLVAGDYLTANLFLVGDVGQRPDSAISEGLSDLESAPGQVLVALIARILSATIWLLGAVGLVLRWRHGHRDYTLVALCFACAPFLMAVSYGGEMLFRVFLFSLPWVALLAGYTLTRLTGHQGAARTLTSWRVAVTPVVLFGLLYGLMVAGFGQEKANHIRLDEVSASAWFYDNAPDASLMMLVNGNFPSRLEGNYGRFQVNSLFVEEPRYANYTFSDRDLPRLIRILRAYTRTSIINRDIAAANAYFVVSSSQTDYADLYRQATPAQMRSLERVLASSRSFEIAYTSPDVRIYRLQRVIRR